MTWDAVIKSAVLTAARQHTPTLHAKLVRWAHEPMPAPAEHGLSVELSVVSLKDNLTRPRMINDASSGDIATDFERMAEVGVQVKVQSADLTKFSKALLLSNAINTGLFSRDVQAILKADTDTDPDAPRAFLIAPLGPQMHVPEEVNNRKASNWIFDARFRIKLTAEDPADGDTINSFEGEGCYDEDADGDVDIMTTLEAP